MTMEGYHADPTDNVSVDLQDWRERKFFGRNTVQQVGLSLLGDDGVTPVDADGAVTFSLYLTGPNETQVLQNTYTATRMGVGLYELTLNTEDTETLGNYLGIWNYALSGAPETYEVYMVVGESNPPYDRLTDPFKAVVDDVWVRFADCFDSPAGGPHLQTYYQAHWSRGRMAQLMGMALRRLNVVSQPYTTYTIDGVGGPIFPLAQWAGLLELGTYVEALRHLRRSYLEQPQFVGGNVTRLDRTDYWIRWGQLLEDAEADLKGAQDTYKISLMFSGGPKTLVSGGIFGRMGVTRTPGAMIARPHYWTRGY